MSRKSADEVLLAGEGSLCVTSRVNTHSEHSPGPGTVARVRSPEGEGGPGPSGTGVDLVLRRVETAGQQQLGGVGRLGDEERQFLALGRGEVLEHEVGRVLPAGRAGGADAHPQVVLVPGRSRDRPQAVVPTLATAALEPDAGEGDVELVVDDDEVGGVEVVVVEQAPHRAARFVHVRRRAGEDDAAAGQPALAGERARPGALARGEPDAGAVGELVEDHHADVVPVTRVAGAGVAQPDHEERAFGHDDGGAGGAGAPAGRALAHRQLFAVASPASPLPWSCGSGTTSPSPTPSAASADSSRSMPASASASASSASRASAVCAAWKATATASGSVTRVVPAGSRRSAAVMLSPDVLPVTSTSMDSGMAVASASTERGLSSCRTRVSAAAWPTTCTGTSTVTFSPRRTRRRSTCSCWRVSGSRCTALVSASCSLPSRTTVSRALLPPLRSAAANSRAGSDRWTTSWP